MFPFCRFSFMVFLYGFPFKSVWKSTDRIFYGVAAAVIAGFNGVPALLATIRVGTNMTYILNVYAYHVYNHLGAILNNQVHVFTMICLLIYVLMYQIKQYHVHVYSILISTCQHVVVFYLLTTDMDFWIFYPLEPYYSYAGGECNKCQVISSGLA